MAKVKMKPAAIFLIVIAVIVILILIAGVWLNANTGTALKIAFVPKHSFAEDTPDAPRDYTQDASWVALPGMQSEALSLPQGVMSITQVPEADIFFIHPTTYLSRAHWNAPIGDNDSDNRVENNVMKSQTSSFNLAGNIYAPRYRQATFGAFLDDTGSGLKALGVAYTDVLAAFDNFIQTRSNGRPFILAGHSQGSLHLLYLLQHRVSGTPLAKRMIAAYIIGWPVSLEADLGAMADISACNTPDDTQCVVSYQTFGMNGNPDAIYQYMNNTAGLNGQPRTGTTMLCTNPLTWEVGGTAGATANLGAIARSNNTLDPISAPIKHLFGAKCGPDGILYLQQEPGKAWQEFKMVGENYHVYDYNMFYMNIRANASLRASTWLQTHGTGR
ncbi:DUF3089 domain-containing protein [Kordiimonas pumila]|uniref:DUF3089 domain-containing protein n=1 Tax=Kordiimonas pumila TaxID=2161677 RepID=A0ABV7D0Q7_9PROT|nr:DUF3089 domain-containing protein [Kordiimonas pumila]